MITTNKRNIGVIQAQTINSKVIVNGNMLHRGYTSTKSIKHKITTSDLNHGPSAT